MTVKRHRQVRLFASNTAQKAALTVSISVTSGIHSTRESFILDTYSICSSAASRTHCLALPRLLGAAVCQGRGGLVKRQMIALIELPTPRMFNTAGLECFVDLHTTAFSGPRETTHMQLLASLFFLFKETLSIPSCPSHCSYMLPIHALPQRPGLVTYGPCPSICWTIRSSSPHILRTLF